MYHEFMLLHTIQKLLYATHLLNSSVTCYIASCFLMLNKKTTPWNAQICSKCNGIGKENVKDQEEYENSITKGENSFNRYYRYTKCSYLFSFTHNNKNHPLTSFLKHPRIATSYSSCFPFSCFCCLPDKQNRSLCIEMKMKRFPWKTGKIYKGYEVVSCKVWTNPNKLRVWAQKANKFSFLFFFLLSTPLKHI